MLQMMLAALAAQKARSAFAISAAPMNLPSHERVAAHAKIVSESVLLGLPAFACAHGVDHGQFLWRVRACGRGEGTSLIFARLSRPPAAAGQSGGRRGRKVGGGRAEGHE